MPINFDVGDVSLGESLVTNKDPQNYPHVIQYAPLVKRHLL